MELATLALSDANARLVLRCEQSSVAIELFRASGINYPVQVRVELRDTAKAARERLVALAATELVAQAERAQSSEAALGWRCRVLVEQRGSWLCGNVGVAVAL